MKRPVLDHLRMELHKPENRWTLRLAKVVTGLFALATALSAAAMLGFALPWQTAGPEVAEIRFLGACGWTALCWYATRPPSWTTITVHNPSKGEHTDAKPPNDGGERL